MKHNVRARVASIVASHRLKNNISSIYDYANSQYINFDTKIEGGVVNGFDYSSGSYFSGSASSSLNFFNYDSSNYVDLKEDGSRYTGFDYESSCYFEVKLSGRNIEIFDYETSSYYNFSI